LNVSVNEYANKQLTAKQEEMHAAMNDIATAVEAAGSPKIKVAGAFRQSRRVSTSCGAAQGVTLQLQSCYHDLEK
jgi:hypothetical protein